MRALILIAALLAATPAPAREAYRHGRYAVVGAPIELHPVLALALHFEGMGKVTPFAGPWCRDFVNMVLERAGVRVADHSRVAIAALNLGPRTNQPRPGDLAVMPRHVGFVVADRGATVEIVSGNWGHRVARATLPRWAFVAFVRI